MSKPRALQHERYGDKKNSDYFEEYLVKIYSRREAAGLDDLMGRMQAVMIQVQHNEALKYLMELYLMTPYRLQAAYKNDSHNVYVLRNKDFNHTAILVLEPRKADFYDLFTAIDSLYPRASEKNNARYLGEIYQTDQPEEVVKILQSQEFRFLDPQAMQNKFLANVNFHFTEPSYFTNNIVGYSKTDFHNHAELGLGEPFELSAEEQAQLDKADEVHHHFGLNELIFGIDHLATRVFSGEREHAILELVCLTDYYFWGAFSIDDMNSSTNICRKPGIEHETHSPAKVFTANNNPFYVQSIDKIPSPTEDFVRNFGKRMHHMAYEVIDGQREDGTKNIDYVVGKLIESNVPFLAQIIGECKDFPDLKQIFSKSSPHSFLITEYVQRCHDFQGFFTKTNVAYLTQAAGEDEKLRKAGVAD